ncbi:LysM peptidoglycan-binding domain-containing protein [Roseovarius sp. C7]|uniref:LysM peptidoglycan-binding domain-containing protein n=1 Tax=Roseovarius sp. C7 TaxID=3398643 RepID=UPI0039F6CD24
MRRPVLLALGLSVGLLLVFMRPYAPDPQQPIASDTVSAVTRLSPDALPRRAQAEAPVLDTSAVDPDAVGFGLLDHFKAETPLTGRKKSADGKQEIYIDQLIREASQRGARDPAQAGDLTPLWVESGFDEIGQETYIVASGDTLASIAYRFYGITEAQHDIFHANKERLAAPDRLRVGQRLILPATLQASE